MLFLCGFRGFRLNESEVCVSVSATRIRPTDENRVLVFREIEPVNGSTPGYRGKVFVVESSEMTLSLLCSNKSREW